MPQALKPPCLTHFGRITFPHFQPSSLRGNKNGTPQYKEVEVGKLREQNWLNRPVWMPQGHKPLHPVLMSSLFPFKTGETRLTQVCFAPRIDLYSQNSIFSRETFESQTQSCTYNVSTCFWHTLTFSIEGRALVKVCGSLFCLDCRPTACRFPVAGALRENPLTRILATERVCKSEELNVWRFNRRRASLAG